MSRSVVGRRGVLAGAGAMLLGCSRSCGRSEATGTEAGLAVPRGATPETLWGIQSGEVTETSAVVWGRVDRPATMIVEWSVSPNFGDARRVTGQAATADTDYTAKVALVDLPRATPVHYRARFEAAKNSEWMTGKLATPPIEAARDVVFAWSGDTNGQGWGIDPARGGMPTYAAVLARTPDFFVHCGDSIYADNPIVDSIRLADGSLWKNVVTPAKSHVAQTLDDYRGAFLYPRLSAEVRALSAAVPHFFIWDDHEVHDNWTPGQTLDDARYEERRTDVLSVHARRAMLEHTPTLRDAHGPMYRSVRWGPRLELFLLDGRSYRSLNPTSHDPDAGADAGFLGAAQLDWLEGGLSRSTAQWKVVVCDMPLGLVIEERWPHGCRGAECGRSFDGWANTDGAPVGRERELARLLSTLRAKRVKNVVWLTADVHYAAAHRYDPSRAAFKDFDPFWEFIAGPMHATAFERKRFDDTFGPEIAYATGERVGSPATGEQYFGMVRIDGGTGTMTVTLVDMRGRDLHSVVLPPA